MTQTLKTPLEQQIVGPHLRHVDPHPQYAAQTTITALTARVATLESDTTTTAPAESVTLSSSAPAAESVGQIGLSGISTSASRSDHLHALPGLATTTVDGFLSAADKLAIDQRIIQPAQGALLDIDNGTLVWDIDSMQQVLA